MNYVEPDCHEMGARSKYPVFAHILNYLLVIVGGASISTPPTCSLFHKAIYMLFVCVVCRFVVWFVQFCFIKRKVHFYVTNYNSTTYIYKYHESRPNSFDVFHKGQLIAPNYISSAEM